MAKKSIYKALTSTDTKHKLGSSLIRHLFERAFLDLAFNREKCWEMVQKSNYIKSLILGRAPSKIIVANIAKCLEKIVDDDGEDYKYFKRLLDLGYEYIAIDGNNRTVTIYEFLKSEVPVPAGTYDLPCGPFKLDTPTTLKKLPPSVREWILEDLDISICEYVVNSRADLSDLFVVINDGIKLNPQELRNAILCPIAQVIRDISKEYEMSFKTIYKKLNHRRMIDEQLVRLAVCHTFSPENGISKTDLDSAYTDDSPVYDGLINRGGKKVIESTLKMVGKYADKGFKHPSILLNLFMLTSYIAKNKLKIIDDKKFFEWFMVTESKRLGDKTIILERRGLNNTYAGCCSATSSDYLTKRFGVLLMDLYSIPKSIMTDLDPERLFSAYIRRKAWEKQGGVCPRTGKTIPESEINNHDLWAADHVIPYSKGGKTELENCELVCKTYNLKKSAKYVEELMAA
jgi:hypothetical protein